MYEYFYEYSYSYYGRRVSALLRFSLQLPYV
eukprot:CAMPEP_0168293472 /NCGR_PEP_ID=MMETSP0142_2-20121227/7943_1 /TAXON_ID=44445 /ORGANISM="Pseudo-nitzschia australis, Strain 10249 10 AB" /LENGTH=30 /DNA_ID= /DNA_START= /DNA_END= /DNA_ORIENTATION=